MEQRARPRQPRFAAVPRARAGVPCSQRFEARWSIDDSLRPEAQSGPSPFQRRRRQRPRGRLGRRRDRRRIEPGPPPPSAFPWNAQPSRGLRSCGRRHLCVHSRFPPPPLSRVGATRPHALLRRRRAGLTTPSHAAPPRAPCGRRGGGAAERVHQDKLARMLGHVTPAQCRSWQMQFSQDIF